VLVLVKHSLPAIDPAVPPAHWHLGEEGRARCRPLAERLRAYEPAALISSTEPKAAETAKLVAHELDLAVDLDERLREQDRTGAPWLSDGEFRKAVAAVFDRPEEVAFGSESLESARDRFGAAIDEHLEGSHGFLVAVAHGTVISAYAEAKAGVEGYSLWRRLGLPSLVVLDGTELVEVLEEV
jgi:broad specificity phosphatase PhoE